MPRLTKEVREKMLQQNEGFIKETYFESKNFREARTYKIADGKLYVREHGKTSWADSKFDGTRVANDEEAHRFLYKFQDDLKYEE